jgi:hypothetical protein
MGNDEKFVKGLNETRSWTKRHYRMSYRFWREQGLAPWCSLRYAIYYRLVGL